MNRRTDAWQNGCFRKMDDHLVHTTPNHHPPKMDVLPKTFLQIILASKWLVWHSSTSPKQQWRPLPSLLSVSSSMRMELTAIACCLPEQHVQEYRLIQKNRVQNVQSITTVARWRKIRHFVLRWRKKMLGSRRNIEVDSLPRSAKSSGKLIFSYSQTSVMKNEDFPLRIFLFSGKQVFSTTYKNSQPT